MTLKSINPTNGEVLATFEALSAAGIEARVQRAASTFSTYRRTPIAQRQQWLLAAAELLLARKAELGRLATLEMGKTIKSAIAEVEKSAWACRHYAENAAQMLQDEEVATNASRSYVRYEPFGPLLMIMPWNFPYWQAIRFAAPSLMAGNVILLKHASNVPQCALAIEDIFAKAGFPTGTLQTLLIGSSQVAAVIEDERVAAVTLTGSEPAGRSVAATAGKHLKKCVLELGGSDPFIVMPSADLARAAHAAVQARVINNGQSCIAAKRFIIHEAVYDQFASRFADEMARLKVGDPLDESTDIGPLATPAVLADIEDQVQRCVQMGARILTGGQRLTGPGNYYQPTVLEGISEDSPAYSEETFGPVAPLFSVSGLGQAIEIANDTPFGLGSSVWTTDPAEQQSLIEGIIAGQVFVNSMGFSDPRLPFGGVKNSGYGRELGLQGIREFVNTKTVWIA